MLWKTFLFVLTVTVLSTSHAGSQTLYFINVADTKDATIGDGAKKNAERLEGYVRRLSQITGLALHIEKVDEDNFSCESIESKVNGLSLTSSDVVLFYYSGHGFAPDHDPDDPAKPAQSLYPWFYCDPQLSSQLPNLEDISRTLSSKGPRLAITIADTCNVVIPTPHQEPQVAAAAVGSRDDATKTLFMKFKGTLLMSSSVRGEYSWYQTTGGLFTHRLLGVLWNPPLVEPEKMWEAVIERVTQKIVVSPSPQPELHVPPVTEQPQASRGGLIYIGGN